MNNKQYSMKSLNRRTLFYFIFLLLSWENFSYSQINTPAASTLVTDSSTKISALNLFEEKSNKIVSKYLDSKQYFISIDIELNELKSTEEIPYLPNDYISNYNSISSKQLQDQIKSVKIDLFLDDKLAEKTKNQIKLLLEKGLLLSKNRGDQVNISNLSVELPKIESEIEKKLSTTERDLKDAKKDLENSSSNLQEIKRKVESLEKEKENLKDQLVQAKSLSKEPEPSLRFWIEKAVMLSIAILSVIFLLLMAKSIAKSIKSIGDGIGSVGNGLQGIAGSISQMNQGDKNKSSDKKVEGTDANKPVQKNNDSHSNLKNIKSIRERITGLYTELNNSINQDNEAFIINYIVKLLRNAQTIPYGVITMELLGKDRANALYHKLPPDAKDEVLIFLDSGTYGSKKYEMMLMAGEQLKTYLMKEGFGAKGGASNKNVLENLIRMSDEEVALASINLSQEALSRLFLYLDPIRSAKLLNYLYKKSTESAVNAIESLALLPKVEENLELDNVIGDTLLEHYNTCQQDKQKPYLNFYRNIVNKLNDNLTDLALEKLHSIDKNIGNYLKSNIITFSNFFMLDSDNQTSILSDLTNKDLALLRIVLSEDKKAILEGIIPDRRKELITEEEDSFANLKPAKLDQLFEDLKVRVIAEIVRLKNEGLIEFKSDDLVDSPDLTNQAA